MTSLTLPSELDRRFTVDPVVPQDAQTIFDLVRAGELDVLGFLDSAPEDIEESIGPTASGEQRLQALVREAASGRAAAWWWTGPHPESARLAADMYFHPDVAVEDADAIAATGWQHIIAWARRRYADWTGASPRLSTGSLHGDAATERRLAAAGFERVRTFWRMSGDVPPHAVDRRDVPDLVIRIVRFDDDADTRLTYDIVEESFAEHWGYEPESYDVFMDEWRVSAGFDPSLWFIAELGGEPVAVMIAGRRMASDNALYIHELGTLPQARGRGVASALLQHAYEVARREGYGKVQLGVDSENSTGAPRLYLGAGLHTTFAMDAWHRPVY